MGRYLTDEEIKTIIETGNNQNSRMDDFKDEIRKLYEDGHQRYFTLVFILNLFNLRFITKADKDRLVKFMNGLYRKEV